MFDRVHAKQVATSWQFIFLCIAMLGLPISCGDAADRPPNVVILLADDLGYADLGFQGCTDIPTPNVDRLAKSGTRCTQGYVSGPYCSPTRAGLLTGCYQNRFGFEFNIGEQSNSADQGLWVTETTMADRMKAIGYQTALVGKWHLGVAPKFHPLVRGFDEFYGFLGGSHSYFPGEGAPIFRGRQAIVEDRYLTDAIAQEAVSFIDRHAQSPFFLYIAFNAVHTPMHATDARLNQFESIKDPTRRKYAAMLTAMDEAIGTILNSLKSHQLEKETLVVFFSDNGGPTMVGTTVNGSSNAPLRGSKRTTLEGGIRVPFVLSWPGRIPAGATYTQPVIQLDVLPTALAAAGQQIPAEWELDGINLLPFLTGESSGRPHETLYWRFGTQRAIRHGNWKLVAYDPQVEIDELIGGLRGRKDPIGPPRLYDLENDIGESRDLAETHPEIALQLSRLFDDWNSGIGPPAWTDRPQ